MWLTDCVKCVDDLISYRQGSNYPAVPCALSQYLDKQHVSASEPSNLPAGVLFTGLDRVSRLLH